MTAFVELVTTFLRYLLGFLNFGYLMYEYVCIYLLTVKKLLVVRDIYYMQLGNIWLLVAERRNIRYL